MALRPLTTYLRFPGALTPQSIIFEKHWEKIDISYRAEVNLYCSAQPSVFSQIVIKYDANNFFLLNSSIKRLLCAGVVEACF